MSQDSELASRSASQSASRRVAIYPGSFDPIHNGHLDLIERCSPLFETLHVGVLVNESKTPLFSVEDRVEMISELLAPIGNCLVESFSGLLVEYAHRIGAGTIVRGLRAVSDFDYELQMVLMNRKLRPEIETIFLTPREDTSYLSSSLLKEVASLGGDVSAQLPTAIFERVSQRLDEQRKELR